MSTTSVVREIKYIDEEGSETLMLRADTIRYLVECTITYKDGTTIKLTNPVTSKLCPKLLPIHLVQELTPTPSKPYYESDSEYMDEYLDEYLDSCERRVDSKWNDIREIVDKYMFQEYDRTPGLHQLLKPDYVNVELYYQHVLICLLHWYIRISKNDPEPGDVWDSHVTQVDMNNILNLASSVCFDESMSYIDRINHVLVNNPNVVNIPDTSKYTVWVDSTLEDDINEVANAFSKFW